MSLNIDPAHVLGLKKNVFGVNSSTGNPNTFLTPGNIWPRWFSVCLLLSCYSKSNTLMEYINPKNCVSSACTFLTKWHCKRLQNLLLFFISPRI